MSQAEFRVIDARFLPSLSTWVMEVLLVDGQIEPGQRFAELVAGGVVLRVISVALTNRTRPESNVFSLQVAPENGRLVELIGRNLRSLEE